MARDDWRLRIDLPEEEGPRALLDRIGVDLGSEGRELAKELADRRLAVTHDEETVFVYAASRWEAERARAVVEAELRDLRLEPRRLVLEHWLHDEERWDDEPPGPGVEDDMLARGYAPWEVRVECSSVEEAVELGLQLEAEGYGVARDWTYVIAGTASRADAEALAERLHGEVEPGGELVWEVLPANPFAVFGGLGM